MGELQAAVTDGRSQVELLEDKLTRTKRRNEKRVKALECELEDLRDVSVIMMMIMMCQYNVMLVLLFDASY